MQDFGFAEMAAFWTEAGQAAMQAQQTGMKAFADACRTPAASYFSATGFDPAEVSQSEHALSQLWEAAAAFSETLRAALQGQDAAEGGFMAAGMRAATDPQSWFGGTGYLEAMGQAATRLAEGPQFADLWNAERQQARVLKTWLEVHRCRLDHHGVVLSAWMRAGQTFMTEYARRDGLAEGKPLSPKAHLALWVEIANRELLETQRSEPFLRTQRALIRASADLKLAQRELAESWAQQFDLPTRTELDDVHQTLTELRRTLRRLERGQVAGQGAGEGATP